MSDAVLTEVAPAPASQARASDVTADELKALAAVADAHAFEVWGDEIARGEPLQVVDAAGTPRACVFPYALGTRTFPADLTLARQQPELIERFGAIYVAAGRTDHPVLRVVHALPPLFARIGEAQAAGRLMISADARLSRIYWLGFDDEYFEISAADRRVLIDVRTLKEVEPDKVLRPGPVPSTQPVDDPYWTVAMPSVTPPPPPPATMAGPRLKPVSGIPAAIEVGGHALGLAERYVPLPECVPAVNGTWWCVPTAFTMATCYYDNYAKAVGGITGYGRLVGYWFDHPKSGHNVPDFIDQLVDPATGTWRTGFSGFADFIKKTYGYTFTTRDVAASAANDWAWKDITAEIDAGRPFVWGVKDHATCAFGYKVYTQDKFVVLHTTWGDTSTQQRQEWNYTQGLGMKAIVPGGATLGENLVLWAPAGGETLLTNVATTVRWFVWGDHIKKAELSVSADGGNTWAIIAYAAPCAPGWNVCDWTPQVPTDRARVRIRGLDAAGAYVAGDGSQASVKVLPGPRPVTLKTILVKTKTDGGGAFSAPHGLERYTPDGLTIRAISVAVQHKNGNWHTLELSHDVDNRFWWNKEVVAGRVASPSFFDQPVQIIVSAESIVG